MLNNLPRVIQDEEDRLKRDREASQSAVPRAQLAIDGRIAPAPSPAPAPALPSWPPMIPENASPEEIELLELLEERHATARRDARIAELQPVVKAQHLEPQLASVRKLFTQLDAAITTAKTDELAKYNTVLRVRNIGRASELNHDILTLLEGEHQAIVVQAMGQTLARLRGTLEHNNSDLADLQYRVEGKRNPYVRRPSTPVDERPWGSLLAIARGET
jgi:hypothetical protein